MIPGETIHTGAPDICPECKFPAVIRVCQSAAGYYLGAWCDCHGGSPYSRESHYFATEHDARVALEAWLAGERWMLR